MSERAFLDFYDQINTVPVHQQGAGSNQHFHQRTALYRSLGITPLLVKDANVLEIGPGSGDNALHIAHWQPASLTFIDGAKASVSSVQERIEQGCYGKNAVIHHLDVSKQTLQPAYDVVLCEGLIPGQAKPKTFLNNVLTAVKPGGVCVFTTVNAVSYLAEICRRVLLPIIEQRVENKAQLIEQLVALFMPSLNSLKGMTRKPEHWVLDNIIHPWTDRGLFSINDAIRCLPEDFSVLGSSPSFLQDWRWYKESAGDNKDTILESYYAWSGYLLDYRCSPTIALPIEINQELEQLAEQAMQVHDRYRDNKQTAELSAFLTVLKQIQNLINPYLPATSKSISAFIDNLPNLVEGKELKGFENFHAWFGRGQQYLSVVKDVT